MSTWTRGAAGGRAGGYNGPSTIEPPRPSLKLDLEAMRDQGAPALGAGMADAADVTAESLVPRCGNLDRWQSMLPPDLPRAAPQIYRSMRAEGVNNAREWMNSYYSGEKKAQNPEWLELWNLASEVDFAVSKCTPESLVGFLASDDGIEIKMRRLAALVHLKRSGDMVSATRMLAIKPPGTAVDLAPTWLVEDATAYSKAEYQRSQRVKGGRGRGGRKGKGKGEEGGGRGDGRARK